MRRGNIVLAAEWVQDRHVRAAIQASTAWHAINPSDVPDYVRQAQAEDDAPEVRVKENQVVGRMAGRSVPPLPTSFSRCLQTHALESP